MADVLQTNTRRVTRDGRCYPLGASVQPDGVNFALYSRHATGAFLLLFDAAGGAPTDVIRIEANTRHIWHVFVEGAKAGQLYGFKMLGDYAPAYGFRFNPYKLLVDPYARALSGKFRNQDNLLLGYDANSPDRDMVMDTRDNSTLAPKSVVVDDAFDWGDDARPDNRLERLVIYEVHIKGFTAHPSSKVKHPGTYLGFIEKIPHLKALGINAVEFLPVHEYYAEDFIVAKGLTNYWGYNTIGFFAPESSYSTGSTPACPAHEFKTLVRELHRAGIEVILDVVYNHSAEGSELGPTVCFRGIDNPTYYSLTGPGAQPARYYSNYTGTGNSLDLSSSHVIRFVMDSLRYWVEVMHVDGFRFDLAAVLGREAGKFQNSASFFDAISQDPVLSRVKLIAEPWDIGAYEVGNFPVDWSEWNGRFRDTARKFVKGDGWQIKDLGWRLTGSADLYGDDGRKAYNSVNFITCHDGFTLHDLTAYNQKHNEANLEGNNDGNNDNQSWNCGAEGETDDPGVLQLRRQLAKNHLCLLLLSMGTPMLLGGDEFLRSQKGNNNAYCQDNEISWFDWDAAAKNGDFTEFCRRLIALTRRYTVLQRRKFLQGIDTDGNGLADVSWYGVDGNAPRWDDGEARLLCYRLDGAEVKSELGNYSLVVVLNSDHQDQTVKLPCAGDGLSWYRVLDTSRSAGDDILAPGEEVALDAGDQYLSKARSTVLLLGR